ncbi:TetR/AcrR family transcriptional regulator [Sphingorhabdus sp.]|uniref:TetR/AcrR family transcriptional regulator n=1 Tax=Sphingorhabdus sp. TaxID=1902408 RepID=UPI00398379B2
MNTGKRLPHRPVDQTKQDAILASARAEFFEYGFASASIERIAAAANVSKVTIYNHFQTKENLFSAMVGSECRVMRGSLPEISDDEVPLRVELMGFAESMMKFLSSPDIIRFDRRMAAEVERHPEMGELFLNAGPRLMHKMLTEMIATEMDRGRLAKADPREAAAHLYGMIKGFADVEWRFSNPESAPESVTSATLGAAVDRFLFAYRP